MSESVSPPCHLQNLTNVLLFAKPLDKTTTWGFVISDGTSIIAQLDYMLKFTAYNGIYHGAFQCVSLYDLSSSCLLSNIFIYGIEDSLYLSVFASGHNGNSGSATPA